MTDHAIQQCLYSASEGIDPQTILEALGFYVPEAARADWALCALAIRTRHRQALAVLAAREMGEAA